jgi:hypothetical protein
MKSVGAILALVAVVTVGTAAAHADDEQPAAKKTMVDLECDPFPFATGGYGCQVGVRFAELQAVRFSIASFSVNVPDVITEIGGNEGFHLKARPSGAVYILYYFSPMGHDGFAVGGALRYLRFRYRHDDVPGVEANTRELSPEAIVGYQWHPFENGFYLQPWIGLSITAIRDGEPEVGDKRYDPLPVQPFFTVNIGWELQL